MNNINKKIKKYFKKQVWSLRFGRPLKMELGGDFLKLTTVR